MHFEQGYCDPREINAILHMKTVDICGWYEYRFIYINESSIHISFGDFDVSIQH